MADTQVINAEETETIKAEQAIEFLENLLNNRGEFLTQYEKIIFRLSWEGKTYEEMFDLVPYTVGNIKKNVAPQLWQKLTKILQHSDLIEKREQITKRSLVFDVAPIVKRHSIVELVGKTIAGRFKITSLKSKGQFGNTYIGEDLQLKNQRCFLKQLRIKSNQRVKNKFEREAGALYQLGWHRQIPGLLAHFEDEIGYFLAHQFIKGIPLSEQLSEDNLSKSWSETKVVELIGDILNILKFVHKRDIIHRDIRPSNLIIRPDGEIVLINFGSIKEIDNSHIRTFFGTYGYTAPEQGSGNPRLNSDIYAVAMIGIQALTGLPPTQFKINSNTGEIIFPEQVSISPEFKKILDKMGNYDRKKRYQSVEEVLKDLEKIR